MARTLTISLIFLTHCGEVPRCADLPQEYNGFGITKLYISYVDSDMKPFLLKLTNQLNSLAGYDLVTYHHQHPRAFSVHFSTEEVKAAAERIGSVAVGVCETGAIYIMRVGDGYTIINGGKIDKLILSERGVRVILAHELGHAMGLTHTKAGLMRAGIDQSCYDREAECLIDALAEQGKL